MSLLVFYTTILCKVFCVLLYNAELAVRQKYFKEWSMQVNSYRLQKMAHSKSPEFCILKELKTNMEMNVYPTAIA